jgi:hypothetical protein
MKRSFWAVLATVVLMAGCGDPIPPTTPTPAVPTITETFTDTLLVLGSNTHVFTVNGIGGLKVTLNSVQPSAAVVLGVGYPNLGSCTAIDRKLTTAGQDVQLSGTAMIQGQFCVSISDPGNLAESATYTITVLHS